MLALFGLGSFAGVTVAGRYADRRQTRPVLVAGGILLLGWCTFALNAGAAVGPVVGGLGIDSAGYRAPLWVSAGLVGTAHCGGIVAGLRGGSATLVDCEIPEGPR